MCRNDKRKEDESEVLNLGSWRMVMPRTEKGNTGEGKALVGGLGSGV